MRDSKLFSPPVRKVAGSNPKTGVHCFPAKHSAI